jgi:hypothetical protein
MSKIKLDKLINSKTKKPIIVEIDISKRKFIEKKANEAAERLRSIFSDSVLLSNKR